jgi:hypothetical protein
MFIMQKLSVDAGFDAARERLGQIVDGGGLTVASQDAYQGALASLVRVGPFGDVPGVSKLVRLRFIGPVKHDGVTTVWLRWEATGAASGLFPVLDADLLLTAGGPEKSQLMLNGCYRPPLGRLGAGLDWAVMHRVASATIRALLHSVADALASPELVPAVA